MLKILGSRQGYFLISEESPRESARRRVSSSTTLCSSILEIGARLSLGVVSRLFPLPEPQFLRL